MGGEVLFNTSTIKIKKSAKVQQIQFIFSISIP